MASKKHKPVNPAAKKGRLEASDPPGKSERPAAEPPPMPDHSPTNPPRRNRPLLMASVAMLVVWAAYLSYVAWRANV